ncbi:hypothetical protein I4F81_012517 [Pyropia yezoensis]|uniref:Uncharacterized protein n=1 Tax=Pyropia yezoensis TaxID=2788 RepID=A0ACC3CJR9_PYRYE|nr:hypothetical protein I4F81_012517 [Neopyropia yezoensis]
MRRRCLAHPWGARRERCCREKDWEGTASRSCGWRFGHSRAGNGPWGAARRVGGVPNGTLSTAAPPPRQETAIMAAVAGVAGILERTTPTRRRRHRC